MYTLLLVYFVADEWDVIGMPVRSRGLKCCTNPVFAY